MIVIIILEECNSSRKIFFLQEDPIYLQSIIIHLANGGNG
jgi:hypothetical protein